MLKIMCCKKCGSSNVGRDSFAQWSIETQQWELSSTYDDVTCIDCGHESHSCMERTATEEEIANG